MIQALTSSNTRPALDMGRLSTFLKIARRSSFKPARLTSTLKGAVRESFHSRCAFCSTECADDGEVFLLIGSQLGGLVNAHNLVFGCGACRKKLGDLDPICSDLVISSTRLLAMREDALRASLTHLPTTSRSASSDDMHANLDQRFSGERSVVFTDGLHLAWKFGHVSEAKALAMGALLRFQCRAVVAKLRGVWSAFVLPSESFQAATQALMDNNALIIWTESVTSSATLVHAKRGEALQLFAGASQAIRQKKSPKLSPGAVLGHAKSQSSCEV